MLVQYSATHRSLLTAMLGNYRHCLHTMRTRVYVSVGCPSVCPSGCPSIGRAHSSKSAAAGCSGFAAVGPAGRRYRSTAARRAAAAAGKCGQCHVVSVRRKLNNVDCSNLGNCLPVSHQYWTSRYLGVRTHGSPNNRLLTTTSQRVTRNSHLVACMQSVAAAR